MQGCSRSGFGDWSCFDGGLPPIKPSCSLLQITVCSVISLTQRSSDFYLLLWKVICKAHNQCLMAVEAAQLLIWTARWNRIILLARLPFVRLGVERCVQLQGRCSTWMKAKQAAVPRGQAGAKAVNYGWLKEPFRETVGWAGRSATLSFKNVCLNEEQQ